MKFGQLMAFNRPELYISPRHDRWMEEHPNAEYSESAMQLAYRELGKADRVRKGTISASSLNSCERSQQFKFMGMPELAPTAKTAGIFHNGSFTHLRWQMAGLTEGWLKEAEVAVPINDFGLSGTADGLCEDGSVLEIKSINSHGFRGISSFGAKQDHQYQLGSYLLCMGIEQGRFIYENKDTQEYLEIPFRLTPEMGSEIQAHAEDAWEHLAAHELAEPLEKCIDKTGWRYTSCPFKDRCLGINSWAEAEQQVLG